MALATKFVMEELWIECKSQSKELRQEQLDEKWGGIDKSPLSRMCLKNVWRLLFDITFELSFSIT